MNKEGAVERALIFHQSGPGSTPFVAKLKEGIYNDACRVYETSLGICKKVAIKVSFQRFYHQYEVPNSVMLTSTNRNKVSLIKVLHHYFYISLVDVKNETDRILHSYTPLVYSTRAPFALLERPQFPSHFFSNAWHAGYRFCCTYNSAYDSNQVFDFHQVNGC